MGRSVNHTCLLFGFPIPRNTLGNPVVFGTFLVPVTTVAQQDQFLIES